ncbi:MAG: ABC transporter substrate-binding protein [Deltaproteobacteria bacterium]|nr:ABC transporter substrate-binding protein [Deltaproteobacteria bacterium]
MKKVYFIALTVLLVSGFTLSLGAQSAMAAEKDKYGGILKYAVSKSPRSFGYPLKIRGAGQEACGPAMELLVMINRKNETKPRLATGWEISPDGKIFTFKLRKGVNFHDGTDFNAQAVKYNMDLWLKSPGNVLSNLKSVDIVDDYTVRLNFSEYDALIMYEMSTEAYMASPTALEKYGEKKSEITPVGTGPFKLKEFERNVALKYERFDDYWQKGRPYLDGVEMITIKDPMTQIAALKTGEILGIDQPAAKNGNLLKEQGNVVTVWFHVNRGMYGDSKNPDSVWSNRKVREAIEYAIDKETIMKEVGFGYHKPLYQPVIPSNVYYNPNIKPRKYDPEKAKKLLAEAGYPNGFETTVTHMNSDFPESWVAIQGYLAKVGIKLRVIPVDRPKYLKIRFEGGLKDGSSHVVFPSENNYLYALKAYLMSTAPQYVDMARPKGFDDAVKNALKAKDPKEQMAFVHQATKILYDDVTFIPLNAQAKMFAMNKSVRDYDLTTYLSPIVDAFTNAWISKK